MHVHFCNESVFGLINVTCLNKVLQFFQFRVNQRVFIYIVDLYTLRYLSKQRVTKVDPSYIHLKLLYLTTVFLSTTFPQGRSFLFTAE